MTAGWVPAVEWSELRTAGSKRRQRDAAPDVEAVAGWCDEKLRDVLLLREPGTAAEIADCRRDSARAAIRDTTLDDRAIAFLRSQ